MLFAAVHESVDGTKLPKIRVRYSVAMRGKADIAKRARHGRF